MEGGKGGSSTPSYKDASANKGKTTELNNKGIVGKKNRDNAKGTEWTKTKVNSGIKDKEEEDKRQGTRHKYQKGSCRPKMEITPRVVLNDPALQAHREHMGTYAIICKFMGIWPSKKALQTWIKYHWKPKGIIDLHPGSKGFFTVVFTNIEDKDSV